MTIDFSPLHPYLDRLDAVFSDLDGSVLHNEGPALDKIGAEITRFIRQCEHPHLKPEHKEKGTGDIRHLAGRPIANIREVHSHKFGVEIPLSVEHRIKALRKSDPQPNEVVNQISEIVSILSFIKNQDIPVMIVTSSERDRAERYIRAAALEIVAIPHGLVSGHSDFETERHKPHPDSYLKALDLCSAHPSRTLTFEDTVGGGQASIAADIPTIGVLLGDHIVAERKESLAEEMLATGFIGVITSVDDIIPVLTKVLQSAPERHIAHQSAKRPANLRSIPGGKRQFSAGD